jgi:DNA-binding NarL/FixJ family response regulator
VKVLIADDHGLMVEGTKKALEAAGGFDVVGVASDGAQVLPLVRRLQPDLVLLDLRMPRMDGLTCLSKIRKEFPKAKVAMLSASQDPATIQAALKRGACAFIVKTVSQARYVRRCRERSSRPSASQKSPGKPRPKRQA